MTSSKTSYNSFQSGEVFSVQRINIHTHTHTHSGAEGNRYLKTTYHDDYVVDDYNLLEDSYHLEQMQLYSRHCDGALN